MLEYIDKIREISGRLLKECQVEMIIGFRKGTLPMMNEPCFIKRPEDVEQLVWDSHCGINLANYLTNRKEKIGVIAKGCDSRNIVTHIIENKIQRDQLMIIGVPCQGMIDRKRIAGEVTGEIREVAEAERAMEAELCGSRFALRGSGLGLPLRRAPREAQANLTGTSLTSKCLQRTA